MISIVPTNQCRRVRTGDLTRARIPFHARAATSAASRTWLSICSGQGQDASGVRKNSPAKPASAVKGSPASRHQLWPWRKKASM